MFWLNPENVMCISLNKANTCWYKVLSLRISVCLNLARAVHLLIINKVVNDCHAHTTYKRTPGFKKNGTFKEKNLFTIV